MSLTLDKLRALRRQAGAVDAAPVVAASASSLPVIEPPPASATGTQQAGLPAPKAPALLAASVTPTQSARFPAPTNALDWIARTIRHADPAALAARAHGKPAALRPSSRSGAADHRATSHIAPAAAGRPARTSPHSLSQQRKPEIPTVPGAGVSTAVPRPPRPTAPSALDWINGAIQHADPATLAQRATVVASVTTTEAATTAAPIKPPFPRSVPAAPATSPATVLAPHSVGDLQRLLATRQRAQATTSTGAASEIFRRDLPGEEIAPGLWLIQAHVPMPMPDTALSLAFAKRPDESVDPRELLFFDTETTGLAGGTGTRAFMIGAADFQDDPRRGPGLRVRQLLIATLGAETAMLDAFASWLGADTVLSSFNGRSYDAPLLKTRYRLARRREPLSALDHIDLLHPARRAWKGLWENCRLGTIEKQVLGIEREDDLPGSQAPAAWLDFLRGGSSERLHRVAAHNHQDVVTLALLMQQLAAQDAAVQPSSSD